MSSKKIWQYPEATSITNDDYILMDSNTETGSQCLKANKIGAVHITKTVTERKVYKASDDNANGFSEVTVAVPYTDVHYDKDDIVSFVGEDLPLKSVTAYIEPQQDLHGYDAPWAGGAGKNLFAGSYYNNYMSENNGVFANTESDTQSVFRFIVQAFNGSDLIASSSQEVISSSGRYYVSITISSSVTNLKIKHNGSSKDIGINCQFTATGTFTISLNVTKTNPSTVGGLEFKDVQIESGSQMTSYAPYSNICPISGWDEVNVGVSGVNVWDEEWEQGVISITTGQNVSGNGIRSKNYSNCKGNTSYYFSVGQTADYIMWYDKDKNFINHTYADSSKVVTSPSNAYYFKIRIDSISTYSNNVSVNYPSTDTSYHAYNGQTYTIDLDGTRYGGKLDVVSGVMTVDRASIKLNDLIWTKQNITNNNWRFKSSQSIQNIKIPISAAYKIDNLCSVYRNVTANETWTADDTGIAVNADASLLICDLNQVDVTALNTVLANQTYCYELATPLTIQLTPTAVKSLLGINNVWADTGEIAVEWQTLYVTPTT